MAEDTFLQGISLMPEPLPANHPDFPAAFVVQCPQLVTRRTVKYQLCHCASMVPSRTA